MCDVEDVFDEFDDGVTRSNGDMYFFMFVYKEEEIVYTVTVITDAYSRFQHILSHLT
jgi:hypothetical protein